MHIIIDGYNFIFGIYTFDQTDLQEVREKFILRLQKYIERKQVELEIIFDSQNEDLFPSTSFRKGLKIVFCQDADDYIREEVEKSRNPASILIISSDLEIVRAVKKQGAKIKSPSEFDAQLNIRKEKRQTVDEKPSPENISDEDVAMWLEKFSRRRD